jgi:hypothetical protein
VFFFPTGTHEKPAAVLVVVAAAVVVVVVVTVVAVVAAAAVKVTIMLYLIGVIFSCIHSYI